MDYLEQSFDVHFNYKVFFTTGIFDEKNKDFATFLESQSGEKILLVVDEGVENSHPDLINQIENYFNDLPVTLAKEILVIPGGEVAKNDVKYFDRIIKAIDELRIDRHSFVAAIGGGSVLDVAGFAAGVAHRGMKHIRIPTTVLSQNDSGVGVKNGINFNGKKNFTGTFAPPVAVFNDDRFLKTLSDREWRAGIAEAIKVALIKDADFFYWIEKNVEPLVQRNEAVMNTLIRRCAELHLQHIASGDPFELGSSRPLDFGHWSAHKVEQLSNFTITHGEAVAMGIALDSMYSAFAGLLPMKKAERIVQLLENCGFEITNPLMNIEDENAPVLKGLQEFREHLGGRLTIMLLSDFGKGEEVHDLKINWLIEASQRVKNFRHQLIK
ncbi:MAG: 3-dehydroquinate synthase [Ginsengibacter sp.]